MRVLLVDNHRQHRAATRALLEACGHRVLEASGGPQALGLLESLDVDILLTDLDMPGMNGLELADRVGELLLARDLPVAEILMSSDSDYPGLRRRVLEGGTAFLRKPFSAAELADEIQTTLARRSMRRRLTEERLAATAPTREAVGGPPPTAPLPVLLETPGEEAEAAESPASTRPLPGHMPFVRPAAAKKTRLRRNRIWREPVWALAAAAALVLTVAGTLQTLDGDPPPLPPPPSGSTTRSTVIQALAPIGTLAEWPATFRWREVGGSPSYRVTVRAVDDKVLWQGTSADPELVLPAELTAELHRAVAYHWTVEALDGHGQPIAGSSSVRFQVRPRPDSR